MIIARHSSSSGSSEVQMEVPVACQACICFAYSLTQLDLIASPRSDFIKVPHRWILGLTCNSRFCVFFLLFFWGWPWAQMRRCRTFVKFVPLPAFLQKETSIFITKGILLNSGFGELVSHQRASINPTM
jgi:hypothetical protein